ncbi:TetR/AcrR family transcriptional regulator [Thalassotalea ganghwensis]
MSKKLSPVDWIKAGFRSLTQHGPEALKAEKLSRYIGSTKGSFYWHFKDVTDFKTMMINHWIEQAYTAITHDVDAISDPKEQLIRLMTLASQTPKEYGGTQVEVAIRAWARSDKTVLDAVIKIDKLRINYLDTLLKKIGIHAENEAQLIYASYLGYLSLVNIDEREIYQGLTLLVNQLLSRGKNRQS